MEKWLLNSAKAIGLSHMEDKIPCQDNVITIYKNDVYAAVLSDGCGSAYFSQYGSKIVVEKVSEYLCDNFDDLYLQNEDSIKKTITNLILDNINKFAQTNIKDINKYFATDLGKRNYNKVTNYEIMKLLSKEDAQKLLYEMLFDATVLFVAIKKEKSLIGHCGDGFILGYKNDEFVVISEEPKFSERNETNYPSSVYNLSKAYKDEKYWNLFRIIKNNSTEYLGFTLMSDGAEKSLVLIKGESSTPVKNNNALLYEIIYNEKPEDASKYLTELLEQTYRERTNGDGDLIEITDDDVSVALMVSTNYNVSTNDAPKIAQENNDSFEQSKAVMFYDAKLRKMLSIKGYLDIEKYDWLNSVFKFLIEKYKEKKYEYNEFLILLKKQFYAEKEDIETILFYGRKCGVIVVKPFEIICSGGGTSES